MNHSLQNNELQQKLMQTRHLYQQTRWVFYAIFIACGLAFVLGLIWMNIIAIASGVISALLFAMAYLGVIMVFDENIQELQHKLDQSHTPVA
ncbi:hypothetical protein PT286_08000 [Neisseriaceae bacterium ESL0693]|nr:hypothetical protein [Neisseriaceae bacterium ESL0693]